MSHVGIVGAGWAGLAAAIHATRRGHRVTLWEATRGVGGRARSQQSKDPNAPALDNGQHLLMGAYTEVRDLMATVGADAQRLLRDSPLDLRWPQGQGLALPVRLSRWPAAAQLANTLVRASGWSWRDRWQLARWSLRWRGRSCPPSACVADLCEGLSATVMRQLITPLCVSALNLPPAHASGELFLTVLRDTLWASPQHWRAWIPRAPLGELFPEPALAWLRAQGADIHLGERVQSLLLTPHGLRVQAAVDVDHLILATAAPHAAALARQLPHAQAQSWADAAEGLSHTAIATAYARAPGLRLPRPMLALETQHDFDAQFVFDLGQLGRPTGCLAAVLSHAPEHSDGLQAHLTQQLRTALGDVSLEITQLVLEKRATFAAKPGVDRPSPVVCPKVWACGDHVSGPYPATLEGAVRSARALPWSDLAAP